MIYLDIRSMNTHSSSSSQNLPYLKLINRRDDLNLKVEESYVLEDSVTVGRDQDNGIAIAESFLSGKHAMFTRQERSYLIEDLGSTNGTFVNGEKLGDMAVILKDGDRIRMGQLDFLYVAGLEVNNENS
jgi:pSer/pThr/pTyr-binding forkhead associated (FHA) protein